METIFPKNYNNIYNVFLNYELQSFKVSKFETLVHTKIDT